MGLNKIEITCIGLFIVLCIVIAYFYPQEPQILATQWDIHGNVSGTMPKMIDLLLAPALLAALILALVIIPRVASVSANIEGFKKIFGGTVITLSIIILATQYQIILWNLGIKINPYWVIAFTVIVFVTFFFWFYKIKRQKRGSNERNAG